jgi:hypothetical protein
MSMQVRKFTGLAVVALALACLGCTASRPTPEALSCVSATSPLEVSIGDVDTAWRFELSEKSTRLLETRKGPLATIRSAPPGSVVGSPWELAGVGQDAFPQIHLKAPYAIFPTTKAVVTSATRRDKEFFPPHKLLLLSKDFTSSRTLFDSERDMIAAVTWSPDGKRIAALIAKLVDDPHGGNLIDSFFRWAGHGPQFADLDVRVYSAEANLECSANVGRALRIGIGYLTWSDRPSNP